MTMNGTMWCTCICTTLSHHTIFCYWAIKNIAFPNCFTIFIEQPFSFRRSRASIVWIKINVASNLTTRQREGIELLGEKESDDADTKFIKSKYI